MDPVHHLRSILDCITDGVVHLDRTWRYTYLNPQAAAMFGRRPEDLVGRHIWTEFPEGVGQPFHLNYERAVREQRVICFQDHYAPWNRWFENRIYPSADGITILFQDITEAKQKEAALRQGQKLESLGLLAAGIAHDFNNLLGALQGHLDLMALGLPPDSALQSRAQAMEAVIGRASQLVRQMLAYAGRSESSPCPLDANQAIRDLTSLMAVSIPKGVELRLDLAAEAPWIRADPALFQQVVMNLLTNATDAIEGASGWIRIATRPTRLGEGDLARDFPQQGLLPGPYLDLEVQDSGCGMDEATQARIFDPFFTTKAQGRGLGLSALLGILRTHSAGLAVQSRPGEGSRFRICFPAIGAVPGAQDGAAAESRSLCASGPVLVVDDEADLRNAVAEFLQMQGIQALEAEDGVAALNLLEGHPGVALAILDLTMPRMGGLELLARIRTSHPDLPVLLTSGYAPDQADFRQPEDPALAFLSKPFRLQDLHQCLHRLLSR